MITWGVHVCFAGTWGSGWRRQVDDMALATFWVFGMSGGFRGVDFIFRLYNLHTWYIFFCKKIKKIKHTAINVMTTWGIFHCTIMTLDSLVLVRSQHANAVGWLIRPQVIILKQADCCRTWMRLRYVPSSIVSCFHSHFNIVTKIIAWAAGWFLLTVGTGDGGWAEAGTCHLHLVAYS